MTVYLVSNLGDGTDNGAANTLNPSGTDWGKAEATLAAAATLATVAGDIILVDRDHQEAATTVAPTWTAAALVFCVDKDASNALAKMQDGTGYIKANSTGALTFTFASNTDNYLYGLNIVHSGTGARIMSPCAGLGSSATFDQSRIALENTAHTGFIYAGSAPDQPGELRLVNCNIVTGNAANRLRIAKRTKIIGGSWTLYTAGAAPTYVNSFDVADPAGATVEYDGMDLSALGSADLVGGANLASGVARFSNCKLGSGYGMLASGSTPASSASPEVYVFDCASGDTHGLFGYANLIGSVVSDTGVYVTAGAAAQSWRIVTTARCNFYTPFATPWVSLYHTGTSAITPYFEILRSGASGGTDDSVAYQDDEVWGEFLAKTTSGSTQSSLSSDRMAILGTAANQAAGTGLGNWTGEDAEAWSGKVDSGSSITPAENGHIRGRVNVGTASSTVYVDPQIRT